MSANSHNSKSIEQRLLRTAREQLGGAVEACGAELRASAGQMVFIRHLELDFVVDLALGDEAIAAHWAAELTGRLARELADARPRANVVFFPDAGAYLARFLVDLAAGRAWQCWYYRPFDGLKMLPLSQALRTVLTDDSRLGCGALLNLNPLELQLVLDKLTAADALTVLERLSAAVSPQGQALSVPAVLDCLQRRPQLRQWAEAQPARGALALWLALRAQGAQGLGLDRLAMLSAIAYLLHWTANNDIEHGRRLLALLSSGDWRSLALAFDTAALHLRPLGDMSRAARVALGEVIAGYRSGTGFPQPSVREQPEYTHFGNAFLLLPLINALPLAELAKLWAESAQLQASTLSWLVLAACQGRERLRPALRDPLLKSLCGVSPAVLPTDVLEEVTSLAVDAGQFNRIIASILLTFERPATIRHALIEVEGVELDVVWETGRGCWLNLSTKPPPSESCAQWLTDGRGGAPRLFSTATPDEVDRIRADLAVLSNPNATSAGSLLIMQLAQIVLKQFAGRLPGFANSSVSYLLENFLSMSAKLTSEPERCLAALSRVPLNVVYNMTGSLRQRYRLPDFTELPVQLVQEG